MSANPTRVDWEAAMPTEASFPMQEGNRVLESIANQEALRALLAFSDLHEQIRQRRSATGCGSDRDLFETERFILDEVLQLISDRAQAITQADGIVVALQQGPNMVCRAAAGPLAFARGVPLIGESEFLQDCLELGRILRCDDCEIDARVEMDFARAIGARSTVLVPLRGHNEQIGVLQAFSASARAFTDDDVRCLDLFSELVLCALKPEDQDRRIHWLADVASDVLRGKPPAMAPVVDEAAAIETEAKAETEIASPPLAETEPAPPAVSLVPEVVPEPAVVTQTAAVPAESTESPEPTFAYETFAVGSEIEEPPPATQPGRVLEFPSQLSLPRRSHAGLIAVLGLVAVAALFSAGAWWGMQTHGKMAGNQIETGTAPAAPTDVLSSGVSDNLMNPAKAGSDGAPLAPVAEDKLAALPKITGVRHWSSSMGSTVVIDMEDQVPYEVHRLMSPERIYFDLHDTVLSPDLEGKTMDVGDASLSRVRVAQPVAGVTRIVLDTKDGSNFSVSMESNPYRLVVELRGSEKTLAANRMPPKQAPADVSTAPATFAAKTPDQPLPARTGKFRIVLDAGHGGWDLGTVGREGLLEKDLVLDVTQRLGKLLQARLGSEVMFTRNGDSYLPLDQRADFANQSQADLFVSVHANYSRSAAARGVETYYTNLFSAPGSKEVEKPDDGTFPKPTPVSLSAGGLREKIEESRRLAASVQRSLYATLAASSPDIRNRGIKDAAFAVLTGTTMPSILTEISFVSSPTDERNLQSAAYRQRIAEALYKGIAGYEQSSTHAKVAQLQRPSAR